MNVTLTHQSGYHSVIENDRGHQVSIDTTATEQPKGASPMELLLMGVAGCSSIDIISILKKKKATYDSLDIHVKGDRIKGKVPSLFTKIHATVRLTGDVAPEKRISCRRTLVYQILFRFINPCSYCRNHFFCYRK